MIVCRVIIFFEIQFQIWSKLEINRYLSYSNNLPAFLFSSQTLTWEIINRIENNFETNLNGRNETYCVCLRTITFVKPFKDEAQTALFKDPVRTAQ